MQPNNARIIKYLYEAISAIPALFIISLIAIIVLILTDNLQFSITTQLFSSLAIISILTFAYQTSKIKPLKEQLDLSIQNNQPINNQNITNILYSLHLFINQLKLLLLFFSLISSSLAITKQINHTGYIISLISLLTALSIIGAQHNSQK